jgi:hypothetical protein
MFVIHDSYTLNLVNTASHIILSFTLAKTSKCEACVQPMQPHMPIKDRHFWHHYPYTFISILDEWYVD